MNIYKLKSLLITTVFLQTISAQQINKYFTADDFAKRRAKVMQQIGNGIAIMQAADLPEAFVKFRQDNNFYYLTGIEIPNAILIIDGKNKSTILLLPDIMPGDIKEEAVIKPGKEAQDLYKIDEIIFKTEMPSILRAIGFNNRLVYLMSSPEETAEMSRDRSIQIIASRMNDPFDGRLSKEATFYKKIKENFPMVVINNLTPILDSMRWIKDDKEITVMRDCAAIGAHAINEAIRITRPGLYEYQVIATCDFVFENEGAQNPAYYAIAASGERGLKMHYNANNHLLKNGEVLTVDYAPDFSYYTTDITRTWPINGKFSDVQLKYYNCVKEAEDKVIAAMKPGITMKDLKIIAKEVYVKNGLEKYWSNYIGHFVGMAVHDVGSYNNPFVPGVVFNVEPSIDDHDLKIHIQLEDTVVITETGSENLTSVTKVKPGEIYQLMKEKGKN